MLIRSAVGLVLVVLLGYGAIKAWPLLSGPSLSIESPADHASAPDGFIIVSGVAHHTESVSLNGAPLLIDQEGRFEKELLLPSGGGILTLTVT